MKHIPLYTQFTDYIIVCLLDVTACKSYTKKRIFQKTQNNLISHVCNRKTIFTMKTSRCNRFVPKRENTYTF